MNELVTKILGVEQEKEEDCLGLYIGSNDMYIAQTSKKSKGLTIEGLLRVPIPAFDKTVLKPLDLNEAFFSSPENWLEPLKKAIVKKKWKTNKVVVSLSSSFYILRHFVIPSIDRRYWAQSIPLQARKYIHYSFESGVYSYHVYELETALTKQKKLGVVFAMTGKKIVDAITNGLKDLGYEVLAIEPSAFSAQRTYAAMDKEAVEGKGRIYSFFGSENSELLFSNENVPLLLRDLDISGPLPIERRRLELGNYIDFISKQLERDPFEEVVVIGQNADEWTPVLEADARKPVRYWDIKEGFGFEPKNIGEIGSIGACSKFVDHVMPDVDLGGRKRVNRNEISAILTMWKIAAIAVILCVGLNIWGKMKISKVEAQLRTERANAVNAGEFSGMGADQIVNMADTMQRSKSEYEKILNSYTATPLLISLARITPPTVWLSKFTYIQPYDMKVGFGSPSIDMEGYINSPRGEWKADIDIGNNYRDVLAGDPIFAAVCKPTPSSKGPEITFPVETSSISGGERKGTRFVLKCVARAQ